MVTHVRSSLFTFQLSINDIKKYLEMLVNIMHVRVCEFVLCLMFISESPHKNIITHFRKAKSKMCLQGEICLLYDSYKKTSPDWLKVAFTGCDRS